MAMGGNSGKGGAKAEINVTPLVDVVLVLLIIFMVITPMLSRGKDVPLPKAHIEKEDKPPRDPLVVSVTSDGKVWVESDEAPGGKLEEAIMDLLRAAPDRPILLKGDRDLQ